MKRILAMCLLCVLPLALWAQEADDTTSDVESGERKGFATNIFFTGQFGGGVMASAGAGIAFLDNIVRPEVLLGYTAGEGYSGFSVNAKLNARILALPVNDRFGMFATIGTSFTFFSSQSQIASAAFISEELEFYNVLEVPTMALYFEQDFFFVPTTEGNMLFQLGVGIRVSMF